MEAAQASDEQAGKEHADESPVIQSPDRHVEEVVLASATGEILHQRSAPEAGKRVTLLDSLASFSARVGKVFPMLGKPDRLEIRDAGSRVICLFLPENKMFVRLSTAPHQYADAVDEPSSQSWLDRAVGSSGVLAGGVRLSNHASVQSGDKAFPEAGLGELAQCLTEVVSALRNNGLGCVRLRWVFENGQIQSARSRDDSIAFVVAKNDPSVASVVEELFSGACLVESGK